MAPLSDPGGHPFRASRLPKVLLRSGHPQDVAYLPCTMLTSSGLWPHFFLPCPGGISQPSPESLTPPVQCTILALSEAYTPHPGFDGSRLKESAHQR